MATRSTVCIDRALCVKVDSWAEAAGLPSGPGHRAKAGEALIQVGLGVKEGGRR